MVPGWLLAGRCGWAECGAHNCPVGLRLALTVTNKHSRGDTGSSEAIIQRSQLQAAVPGAQQKLGSLSEPMLPALPPPSLPWALLAQDK